MMEKINSSSNNNSSNNNSSTHSHSHDAEEPDRKRRHVSAPAAFKKLAPSPSPDSDKKVDAAMLNYQNQKLEQQIDVHKNEINALQSKLSQLRHKQEPHEDSFHAVRDAWISLIEKIQLLAARSVYVGKGDSFSKTVSEDNSMLHKETFASRLQESGATESSKSTGTDKNLQSNQFLSISNLARAIDVRNANREEHCQTLKHRLSADEYGQQNERTHSELRKEVEHMRSNMDTTVLKHKDLAQQCRLWRKNVALDQVEIKTLTNELEESVVELESTRQKITALRNQKDMSMGKPVPLAGVKREDSENCGRKPVLGSKVLETTIEEAKSLALLRLKELEDSRREKACLTKQFEEMQASLEDKNYITKTHLYTLLAEQVEDLKRDQEGYQYLLEKHKVEKETISSQNKDPNLNVERIEVAARGNLTLDNRIGGLEAQLQSCITEKCNLNTRLDEITHTLDRQDEVAEFRVMVSTLEKEMCMMHQQLDKYKETRDSTELLTAEVESISAQLEEKTSQRERYLVQVSNQESEIKLLRDEVRLLRESEQELKLILDMYGSESTDTRDMVELKEAEASAWIEVEKLKVALDDHGLELRVRVANEAEAACQQRLVMAEAEISDLRCKLDSSKRAVMELNEADKMKNEEHEAYLAEIETIGQAYEDMQMQNQRLLRQISDRDDYNIKLVSDSVKGKQHHSALNEENQALGNYIHHATCFTESQKLKITKLKDQVSSLLDQLRLAIKEGRQNSTTLEAFRRTMKRTEKECLSTRLSLEAVQKEIDSCRVKIGGIQARVEKERHAKRKCQEELAAERSKLELQSEGSPLIEKLQTELKEYKTILKCSVCHDRPKDVVITKCYHLFCGQCIKKNLEIRHRKCPGCGVNFGQSDVRNVYI